MIRPSCSVIEQNVQPRTRARLPDQGPVTVTSYVSGPAPERTSIRPLVLVGMVGRNQRPNIGTRSTPIVEMPIDALAVAGRSQLLWASSADLRVARTAQARRMDKLQRRGRDFLIRLTRPAQPAGQRLSSNRPISSPSAPIAPPPPEDSERVVVVNVADAPPTFRVVTFVAENSLDVVWRTHTVWPLLIVPGLFVKVPLQPREYAPLELSISTSVSIPVIVTVSDLAALSGCRSL